MSRQARAENPPDEPTDPTTCLCGDDHHQWSAPEVETVNTVDITRWRCTCPHCGCDGMCLTVHPTDTGFPQHRAVAT